MSFYVQQTLTFAKKKRHQAQPTYYCIAIHQAFGLGLNAIQVCVPCRNVGMVTQVNFVIWVYVVDLKNEPENI